MLQSLSVRGLGHHENDRVADRKRPKENIGDDVPVPVLEAFIYIVKSPGGETHCFFACQRKYAFHLDKMDTIVDDYDIYRDENKDPIYEGLRTSSKFIWLYGSALS